MLAALIWLFIGVALVSLLLQQWLFLKHNLLPRDDYKGRRKLQNYANMVLFISQVSNAVAHQIFASEYFKLVLQLHALRKAFSGGDRPTRETTKCGRITALNVTNVCIYGVLAALYVVVLVTVLLHVKGAILI